MLIGMIRSIEAYISKFLLGSAYTTDIRIGIELFGTIRNEFLHLSNHSFGEGSMRSNEEANKKYSKLAPRVIPTKRCKCEESNDATRFQKLFYNSF